MRSGVIGLILALLAAWRGMPLAAEVQDPFDPFDATIESPTGEDLDRDKSAAELTLEGYRLMEVEKRLLDGRTKLLKALEKDPKYYEAHTVLAGYYMRHVGHFRLSLKYVKQAMVLFEERYGKPPYSDPLAAAQHSELLYLLSQARLNLDNYQGALDTLDEFSAFGYYSGWYPGSRAWVLMKLGRIEEAIRVARIGVLSGAEPGRTLNMLGILLSMTGDRENSIKVFNDAFRFELSLGADGEPATPLNNVGEVYEEIFQEEKAIGSWLKATRLPDGCEHVLPSLNLALLLIEQLDFAGAKRAIDNFESCVAQFPLRNGEEHRALVHLARGRVALHTGFPDAAIEHLQSALDRQQWFGKIGTSQEDLQVGALVSLAQALRRKNNHLQTSKPRNFLEWLGSIKSRWQNSIRAWWLMRRGRLILAESLADIEDLSVRNTDSMIEYPTFGELVAGYPFSRIDKRIAAESERDRRKESAPYYRAYLAEACLQHWRKRRGLELIDGVLGAARDPYDDHLKLHLMLLRLQQMGTDHKQYNQLATEAFRLSRAALRNYGLRLPVNASQLDHQVSGAFKGTALLLDDQTKHPFAIRSEHDGEKYTLHFLSEHHEIGNFKVTGSDLREAVNKLVDTVFRQKLE